MRILHTSDWHLGKDLEGHDRMPEHRAFVHEIAAIADDRDVDVVLLAGDVFDVFNPRAAAEALFFEALDLLAKGGRRAVVVVAGNHDSPDRLRASAPLAARAGVTILGVPRDAPLEGKHVVAAGPSRVELAVPNSSHRAVIAALPYASESRLAELLTEDLGSDAEAQRAYSRRVGKAYSDLAAHFRADTVNLAVGHLFARGGLGSESEREVQLGGAYVVNPEHLPAGAHYVALGHLHKAQEVLGAPSPTFYAGSPLYFSASEIGVAKGVMLVEAEPGKAAKIDCVPLRAGRPIEVTAPLAFEHALRFAEDANARPTGSPWLIVTISDRAALTADENAKLRKACPTVVQVRCRDRAVSSNHGEGERRREQSPSELFRAFYRSRKGGDDPGRALVETFEALLMGLPEDQVLDRAGGAD